MNKSHLADRIAVENGVTRSEAKRWVDHVLKAVSQALGDGAKVSLSGFGTFEVRQRREKRGRNPRTGERLLLPQRKAVVFKPSPSLGKPPGLEGSLPGGLQIGAIETDGKR